MPYKSKAQAAYIHMKAAEGTPWAKKFVSDSHDERVPKIEHVKHHEAKESFLRKALRKS